MPMLFRLMTVGVFVLAGCGKAEGPPTESSEAKSSPKVASDTPAAPRPAPGGTLVVTVRYGGEPVVETVNIQKDQDECGETKQLGKVAVGPNQGLMDAVVAVDGSDPANPGRTAQTPTLDQRGCEFRPRVLAMTPGEVTVLNSDGVLHNIHTTSKLNQPVNKAQPGFKKRMTLSFAEPEVIQVRCDVHQWMEAWIVVLANPRFGVTGADGMVRIERVTPGRRTVRTWHPVLGAQSQSVEVRAGETTRVAFELKAGQTAGEPPTPGA